MNHDPAKHSAVCGCEDVKSGAMNGYAGSRLRFFSARRGWLRPKSVQRRSQRRADHTQKCRRCQIDVRTHRHGQHELQDCKPDGRGVHHAAAREHEVRECTLRWITDREALVDSLVVAVERKAKGGSGIARLTRR